MKMIYVSGPMTGYIGHNFPAFFEAEQQLRAAGYDVINPARKGIIDGWTWAESAGQLWRPDVADGRCDVAATAETQNWREWAPAIKRWEDVLGVEAPVATVVNDRAKMGRSLNPWLPEWMMGIPGRITSVPGLDRNTQIKLAGNGVVPQQAILAITELYDRLVAHLETTKAA